MATNSQRVKAVIAYDGHAFYGFQKQKTTQKTISESIEKSLKALHIDATIIGSGRTDRGVHATGQVIHFDIPDYWNDLEKLKLNLNRQLTAIKFKKISKVPPDFHARFHAKKRVYRYVFKIEKPSLFEEKYIAYYENFDTHLLRESLKCFEGRHDFDFFRKTGTDTYSSIREIYHTHYTQRGKYHIIYFHANGFLRAQVRMMIDVAMQYAQKKCTLLMIQEQLNCQIKHITKLAPAEGLYLARVLY